jgi:hypothetical protein
MAKRLSQGSDATGASPATADSTHSGRLSRVPAVQLAQRVIRQYMELMEDGTSTAAKLGGITSPAQSARLGLPSSQRASGGSAKAGAASSQSLSKSRLGGAATTAGSGGVQPADGAAARGSAGGKAAAVAQGGADGEGEGEGAVLVLDGHWMASGSGSDQD